jgi:hypothetical protein
MLGFSLGQRKLLSRFCFLLLGQRKLLSRRPDNGVKV